MAQFNLQDYETVEERLRRLYDAHPDARVITKNLTTLQDRQVSTWVVQAEIWLPTWTLPTDAVSYVESNGWYLKAAGLAFEIDGSGMTQKANALETCETSSIGRALANMNMSGSKRASRTEMEKAQRGITPKPTRNWDKEAEALALVYNIDGLRALYSEAQASQASAESLENIKGWASVASNT